MTNVEIYDTSNSDLSTDEYSHEEDDDALMEAAVSKQASPGNSPMKGGAGAAAGTSAVTKTNAKPSENPDHEDPVVVDAAGKDKIPEGATVAVQEPPSTTAETLRRIRQLTRPFKLTLYYKRRSVLWLKQNENRKENYLIRLQRKMAILRRRRYSSDSRSLSSNSNRSSRSRSHSRSYDRRSSSERSRSGGSQTPELICLDDTENEDSPEKPEEAEAADVTPRKENKTKKPPAQPQFEQQKNEKSNENGTSSVLEEFLMIKEPKQPPSQAGIELDKLTASLELEQAIADTTLVQEDDQVEEVEAAAVESMAVDVTLKRRRSVTPPLSNDKRPKAQAEAFDDVDEDDDTIEFLTVAAPQNAVEATPLIKVQSSELPPKTPFVATPTANPIQSQPAFKLSTPYSLALSPAANTKQAVNLTALSPSLNTPTPPAVPMEISYPTDSLPPITKSNIVIAHPPEQPSPSAYGSPLYAAPLQLPVPDQAHVGPSRGVPAQDDLPRAAVPLQAATSEAVQGPFATPQALGPPRAHQPPVGSPRASVPLQAASPRAIGPLQASPSRPTVPLQAAAPARPVPQQQQQPPAQLHQEQPPVPVDAASFVVPHQPQPRRSETVSTQTQVDQPEDSPPTARQKPAAPDLKNSEANFHHRLKELFPELDSIFREKTDSALSDTKCLIEEIDVDVRTLDKLLAQKEDEWNRLLHLRCAKMELRDRLERRERLSIIKKLLPAVINKGCSTSELYELQESLRGEQNAKMPALRSGATAMEQCLNNVEINQNTIQRLRGVMGLKSRHFEEEQREEVYRRSLPDRQASMRDLRDAVEELEQRDYDMPPASKRPKLLRGHERYADGMSNSTPNLAAASSSSSHNKMPVPGKHPYHSHASSLDNHLENESQIKPLFNSSPMVFQRNLDQRQYEKLHSTTYRNEEEMPEVSGSKGSKKSQRGNASLTINGRKDKVCHHCQRYEAIYACSSCQNQWYCSSECQLGAWDSHYKVCGKQMERA